MVGLARRLARMLFALNSWSTLFHTTRRPPGCTRDRDSIYGGGFKRRLAGMGFTEVVSAPASPWHNRPEAQALATPNDPHIGAIYGLDDRNVRSYSCWNWCAEKASPEGSPGAKRNSERGGYEKDLDQRARQKRWDRSAANGHFFAGGADVGRKEAKEQKTQAECGEPCGTRQQEAQSTNYFKNARERYQQIRPWEHVRHHADEISATLAPVRRSGEQEHAGKSHAQRSPPAPHEGTSQVPCQTERDE
jgi:hypothetical protein